MHLDIQRLSSINAELRDQRNSTFLRQLRLGAVTVAAGGFLVATTLYMGPIIAAAGALGGSFATDIVVAANLAKLGQVLAGAGLGITGAPASLLVLDTASVLAQANYESQTGRTLYTCELAKKIDLSAQKARFTPYIF